MDPRDQALLNEILREMGQADRFRFGTTTTTTTTTRRPPTVLASILPFIGKKKKKNRRKKKPRPPIPRQPRLTNDDVLLINQILRDLRNARNISTSSTIATRGPRQFFSMTDALPQQQFLTTTTPLPIMVLTPQTTTPRPQRRRTPRPRGAKLLGLKIKNFLNNVRKRIPFFGRGVN